MLDYNVPTRYHPVSASELQQLLISRDGMSGDIALDFTEQLMIFEKCSHVYARVEFVRANGVGQSFYTPFDVRVYYT
jgi:hypothetical protein